MEATGRMPSPQLGTLATLLDFGDFLLRSLFQGVRVEGDRGRQLYLDAVDPVHDSMAADHGDIENMPSQRMVF